MSTDAHTRREVIGYEAVRQAARDYETYSSDLQGDRDVRDYRQLPLEADPPRHTLFRDALGPLFMSAAIAPKGPRFEALARDLIAGITADGGGDIPEDLALPFVIGCLTIIYDRPQDYDEWIAWGPDVWTAEAHPRGDTSAETRVRKRERVFGDDPNRSGATLEAYLDRVFDAAATKAEAGTEVEDVWDKVYRLEIDGHGISRKEMFGIANVLLAGGRDTVIKLITGLVWHLIKNPEDREYLRTTPDARNRAVGEMVRFLSPLPKMERVLPDDRHVPDTERDTDKYVLLSYVSANFDASVWQNPEQLDIHRPRKPHLAFGFGRHSCMGMNITEHEAHAFLSVILNEWPGWTIVSEDIDWAEEETPNGTVTVLDEFVSLQVEATA